MKLNICIRTLLTVLFLLSSIKYAHGQNFNISSKVISQDGDPVANAYITTEGGRILAVTDSTGSFSISNVPDSISLYVSAEGFLGQMINAKAASNDIIVVPDINSQKTNLPYRKIFKKDIGSGISVINPKDFIDKDFNKSLIGGMNGRVNGLLWYNNIWGLQNAQVFIDGVPRNFDDVVMDEVEQITVLKGAHAVALYGSIGAKGVILVTTKRGEQYKRKIDVRVNSYLGVPKMYPSFLNTTDYMKLYNEARINDGLPRLYSDSVIANYQLRNKFQYPDVNYYSGEYLRSTINRTDANVSFSGGNQNARFFTNIGYERGTTLLNIGEGKNENDQRFNARGNVDLQLNEFISSTIDVSTIFYDSRRALGNYWQRAATILPFKYSPLIPLSLIHNDSILEIAKTSRNIIDGKYILGGSQEYLSTPFADLYVGGYNKNIQRVLQISNKIKFDLSAIAQGLTFNTNIHADYRNAYNQSINNSYAVFTPIWKNDSIISLTKFGNDYRPGIENINNTSQTRNIGASAHLNYEKIFNEKHRVNLLALMSGMHIQSTGIYQPDKYFHWGFEGSYYYNNKYGIDLIGVWTNSTKLPPKNRIGFSPSLSLSWVISEEEFMKNYTFIDYLKILSSFSILKTDVDINNYFLYENYYSSRGYYAWNDNLNNTNNSATVSLRGHNPDLTFPSRKEINIGFESVLFREISLSGNYFFIQNDGLLTQRFSLYPSYLSDFVPYTNYNANRYMGIDFSISYNKSLNQDNKLSLGITGTYVTSKVIKRDELYAFNYLNRTGRPVDAIFGLQSKGFFSSEDDIKNSPTQMFGEVRPGDIKYVDQNGDNIIDQNDEVMIGRWIAPFSFGAHFSYTYKSFTLFALFTGNIGGNGVKNNDYYWVDGDDKYSNVVLNRWTEQTKSSATYPRLSSLRNENNFRYSDFWIYKTDRLDLSKVQLTYNIGQNRLQRGYLKRLQVYINGSNLFTFSKNKEILNLNIYSAPQMTFYSLGIKANF
ncbi:MAG: SusC/RagA family TonB-linked outer membrane protein [Bacteroidales bacterium]|nr:SusC/RagA family TonB-linked outer membrane protein [Bacteroidales bacterium]